jgi:hypothetical protein
MRFAIVASPRTGSSLLVQLLHAHEDIFCNGEIFNAKIAVKWPREEKSPEAMQDLDELRRRNPITFIDYVTSRSYGRPHCGFKIFESHNDVALEHVLSNTEIRKIILLRKNLLAVYSSALIAKETGNFHSLGPRMLQAKIRFAGRDFRKFCAAHTDFYRRVLTRLCEERQPFYTIDYEQLNDPWLLGGVAGFIGARPMPHRPSTQLMRQNSSAILERFSNSGRAAAFLEKHDLQGWRFEAQVSFAPRAAGEPRGGKRAGVAMTDNVAASE